MGLVTGARLESIGKSQSDYTCYDFTHVETRQCLQSCVKLEIERMFSSKLQCAKQLMM
jgi:hypothetical protein